MRFLLAACRDDISVRAAAGTIDWDVLLALAAAMGVAPLVYRTLRHARGVTPEPVMAALRRYYAETAASNLRQSYRLENVLRTLAERSIPAMLLKGAALLRLVYRDPGLRPMRDVDLLVRHGDLQRGIDALMACGLLPVQPGREEEYKRDPHHHWVPCVTPDGSLVVELHYALVPRGGPVEPVIEDVWQRAQFAAGNTVSVLLPSPADLLLHLCIHSSIDALAYRLRSLCDVAETVRWAGTDAGWDGLVESARQWNAAREAYCILLLTEEILAPGIPVHVLQLLKELSGFHTGEEVLLLGVARQMALRPEGLYGAPHWFQEKTWEWAITPAGLLRKMAGMTGSLWDALQVSARAGRPDLPAGRARCYAAAGHPFVLLWRRITAAARQTHDADDSIRTRN
jgi:hypothetical protein